MITYFNREVGTNITVPDGTRTIDATGRLVMPGRFRRKDFSLRSQPIITSNPTNCLSVYLRQTTLQYEQEGGSSHR